MIEKLFWLAASGACGTLARYGLSGLVYRWLGSSFPWGTAVVNILGSLLFGIIWSASGERNLVSPELRIIILGGFMGAFTTFSTFISETGLLFADSQLLAGFGNVLFQVTSGIAAFFLGLMIGRLI